MRKIVLLFSLILLGSFTLSAQNQRVSGRVTGSDGSPAIGATVVVSGTTVAAITDVEGQYSINAPSDGSLDFSLLGMVPQNVPVSGRTTINVQLEIDAQVIDNVVVTALGITRSEKTLGYSATTVGGEDLISARTSNVANALSGKIAGVQVSTTSGDPGAVSNIIIRGLSSINGNNQPLYVVDGVPLQDDFSGNWGRNVALGGIANVSPEDIEAMTVLKGAAATALYGSRAANGVIVITTKSGKSSVGSTSGRNFTINYSGNVQLSQISMLPELQNQFGQGWNGRQTFIENGSWGPEFDGSQQVYGPIWNNQQLIHEYSAKKNNIRDFFETGVSQNHSVSLSGVSADKKMDYYLSFSHSKDDGSMPGDYDTFKRTTLAFRNSFEATKWLKVSSSVNFARNSSDVVGAGPFSVIDGLVQMSRDISVVDMKDLSSPFNRPEAYFTPYGILNPYWVLENFYLHSDAKQIFGKVQLDVKPIPEMTLSYRMGFDYLDSDRKMGTPKIVNSDDFLDNDYGYGYSNQNLDGQIFASYRRNYELNHDFLANYARRFLDGRLDLNINAGANINERASTGIIGQTDNLSIPLDFWQLSNGAVRSRLEETQTKRRLIGVFGDVTVGWDDMIYLNLTARNDWSSTLPVGANSYFYPGATLSWIFTELIPRNNALDFGKVRLAYGKTGNDATPYRTGSNYVPGFANGYYGGSGITFPMQGTNAFIKDAVMGSSMLRPEMTSEFEAGLNMQFFNGRIGLDAAFYNRITKDQEFRLQVDPATGYNSKVVNFGEVRNRGIELLLTTVPVRTRDFQWTVDVNWSKNYNMVLSLPEGLEGGRVSIPGASFSAGNSAMFMYGEVGKPMGQFYAYLPEYTADGRPIVDGSGQHILKPELKDTGKNMNNDWIGGINTSFTWKDITLSAALDVRQGGYMFTRTKETLSFTGNTPLTTYNQRRPFIIPNSVVETKDSEGNVTGYAENTTPIYMTNSSYQLWIGDGAGTGGEYNLINRSFVKLRNISLTWSLPAKWTNAISLSRVSVSAYCNNVFTWTARDNRFIDPEGTTISQTNGDLAVQFGETEINPTSRLFGCNISIQF